MPSATRSSSSRSWAKATRRSTGGLRGFSDRSRPRAHPLQGGWLGDRFGNKRVLLAGYLGWALLCSAFPFAGTPYLLPIAVASGLADGSGFPVGTALVTAAVPPQQRRGGVALSRAAIKAGS